MSFAAATDLHDGLGSTLAGIALGIDTARRGLPPEADVAGRMTALRPEAPASAA